MIAGLRGTVEGRTSDSLLLGVGGFVLQVYVPSSVLASAPQDGESLALYTHLYVREDNLALYGFASQLELEAFRLLLGVTGVGPRVALSLLSSLGVSRLAAAVSQEQADVLSAVPGVGKRTAARLTLELKGKLGAPVDGVGAAPSGVAAQTIAALTSLGYNPLQAQEAWTALPSDTQLDVEQAVRACLAYLAERR